MTPSWYRLVPPPRPPSLVVVDATDAGGPLWDGPYLSTLQEIAEQLRGHPVDVIHLGDQRTVPISDVLAHGYDYAAQLGRLAVAGPALWRWAGGSTGPILILSVTPVLDLADWVGTDVVPRVCVYRPLGASRVSPPAFRELGPDTPLAEVVAHLRNPVARVEVGGEGVLPVAWPAAFRVDDSRLTADGDGGGAVLRLAHGPDRRPTATYFSAGGAAVTAGLQPCPAPLAPAAVRLTAAEQSVVRRWVNGNGYWCGACSASHAPGVSRCPSGNRVFPSLPAGTYLLEPVGATSEWAAVPVPSGRAVAEDGRVLVADEGRFVAFAPDGDGWDGGQAVGAFPATETGAYFVTV